MVTRILGFLFLLTLCLNVADTASAQGMLRPGHYFPARPTMSPYFSYSAFNTTGIPTYYSYVRPQQELQQYIQATRTAVNSSLHTPADYGRVSLNESVVADMVVQRIEMRGTTGVGSASLPASYMNYSHYYPAARQMPQRFDR